MQKVLVYVIIALLCLVVIGLLTGGSIADLGGDDAPRMFYLVVLLLLVGSGIFAARRNWGETARNVGIWALIALAFVAVYVYRNDAQDFASRITAGLIPGRAATIIDDNGFNTVVLYQAQNGHYQADMTVNGQTIPTMVDTGASTIALSYEDAEKLGLNPETLDFSSIVNTANGPARTAYVTLPEIEIGGIKRSNIRAGIAERGKLGQSLLGMNFLGSLTSFTFSGEELRLRD